MESPRRAYFKLTEAGRKVLEANPKELNVAYLKRYPAYLEFIGPNVGKSGKQEEKEVVLESAYGKIRKALASRYGKGKEAAAVSCSFFINLIKHERHAKMDKFCPGFVDCFLPGFGIPR